MTRTIRDIAWLAGLTEGEGAFVYNKNSFVLTINSTDLDVMDKAARILDVPVRGPYTQNGFGTKPIYRVTAYGAEWPLTLYAFLCARRRARIRKLLDHWRLSGTAKRRRRLGYHGLSNRVSQEPRNSKNRESFAGGRF